MEFSNTLYTLGLLLVILFICTSLDDFIWDLLSVVRRIRLRNRNIDITALDNKPPKLLALIIAAWNEDNVLEDVIENIIVSQQYPRSMYHIFLGVYPNDPKTIRVAQELDKKYPNVHCVINEKPGPTSKAQNINYVIREIRAFEEKMKWTFAMFTIHDSEDVVHPYEFKVTSHLMDENSALQFPVFPLIRKPTFRNYFQNITTNTYVDEFSENHLITMVGRHNSGAFVPSAGTGFSLSREVISLLGETVLPEDSLTEDYRLSLTLYERGINMRYVLERVKRVGPFGRFGYEYIATRSMFPNTFKTAVKQKTRWTLGITMQSFRLRDILKNDIPLVGRYSLYKDQKAKIGNLLAVLGYPVFIYFILSLFYPLAVIYPKYSLSWYLSLVVTVMMIERQLFRGISLYQVYGLRSALFGVFFPPLLPLRLIWGNIINFVSTVRAYLQFMGKSPRREKRRKHAEKMKREEYVERKEYIKENREVYLHEKTLIEKQMSIQSHPVPAASEMEKPSEPKFAWSKTDHTFLDKDTLQRFHRKLGDILLEKGYITPGPLMEYLSLDHPLMTLGAFLKERNIISDSQLMEAVSDVKGVRYILEESLPFYDLGKFSKDFDEETLRELKAFPLLYTGDAYLFVYCDLTPPDAQTLLRNATGKKMITALSSSGTIYKALDLIFSNQNITHEQNNDRTRISEAELTPEQILIVNNYAGRLQLSQEEVSKMMGLHPYLLNHSGQAAHMNILPEESVIEAEAVSL